MFRQDLKRGLTGWGFWVGAGAYTIFLLSLLWYQIFRNPAIGTPLQKFMGIFALENTYLPAVLCVLPLGTAFHDEWSSKYYRMLLPRSGWRNYTWKRVASTAILGGLIILIPTAIAMAVCYANFPEETLDPLVNGYFKGTNINEFPLLRAWFPSNGGLMEASAAQIAQAERSYSAVWLFSVFIFGACWSQLGLAVSAWQDNWALILVVPLSVFMFFESVGDYLRLYIIKPHKMLTFGYMDYPLWVTFAMPVIWAVAFILLYMRGMRRRRRHE